MNHPRCLSLVALVALVASLVAAGCTAGSPQRQDYCAQTACEQRSAECERAHSDACRACQDALFSAYSSGIIPIGGCDLSCGPSHCSTRCYGEQDERCVQPGVRFVLPEPDAALQAACERAVARDRRCNEHSVEPACAASAALERPEHAAVYDCIAGVACGASVDAFAACDAALHPGSLGDELCGRMFAVCQGRACTQDFRAAFAGWQPWLRDDALAAIRGCIVETSCDGFDRCVNAFVDAATARTSGSDAGR